MYLFTCQIKTYLKNILLYVGLLSVFLLVFWNCKDYLNLSFHQDEASLKALQSSKNKEISGGYIPSSENEKFDLGVAEIKNTLRNEMQISEEDIKIIEEYMNEHRDNLNQISTYLDTKWGFRGAQAVLIQENEFREGSVSEVNDYITTSLSGSSFMEYFSIKFSDFLGVGMVVASIVLFCFMFKNELNRNTYNLLHTMPIKKRSYVISKVFGAIAVLLLIAMVIVTIFTILASISYRRLQGSNERGIIEYFSLFKNFLLFVFPNIIYIGCFVGLITVWFRTPVPSVPILLMHLVYSNMGSYGDNKIFGYKDKFFSILTRFPEDIFETSISSRVYINQLLLILSAIIFIFIGTEIWERRRAA